MPLEDVIFRRKLRAQQTGATQIVAGQRPERVAVLKAKIAQGRTRGDRLTLADGTRRYVHGVTKMDADVTVI